MSESIVMTEFDRRRLLHLIEGAETDALDRGSLQDLRDEIERAQVVPPDQIPSDRVTMNSRVRITDVRTGESRTVTIVFPGTADASAGKISILAPLGTALLGYAVGDVVEWQVPAGLRHYRIETIEYQPEASGDWRS